MATELSVYLPNIPGQFNRVLTALTLAGVNVRGFSVSRSGATSELRLLFTDASETETARAALVGYNYEVLSTELLVLSYRDRPAELLRITEALAEIDINIEYGYFVLGQMETGEVLLALKVPDSEEAFALKHLTDSGFTVFTSTDDSLEASRTTSSV